MAAPAKRSVTALAWFCKETGSPITIFWESLRTGKMKYTEIAPDVDPPQN